MKHFLNLIIKASIICFITSSLPAQSQNQEVAIGIRLQKAIHLYWENGVNIDYTHQQLWQKRIHAGFSYCTSRWGTAWHSNAIKQDNYLLYAALHLRKGKMWQPMLKINGGYFYSDMEIEMFEVLPHQSPLASVETGLQIQYKYPIRLNLALGYNFITGNGTKGPGTLYPVFYQFTLQYVIHL